MTCSVDSNREVDLIKLLTDEIASRQVRSLIGALIVMEMCSGTKRRKKKNVKEEKMTELSPASKTASHGEDDHGHLAARASLSLHQRP